MFLNSLERGVSKSGSSLCVGLDPQPEHIPTSYGSSARGMLRYARWLVDSTAPWAAAYKANLAFYLSWGAPGLSALGRIVNHIHNSAEAPVILDGKWGDIASTAAAYADAAGRLGVDALTCSVYMGQDAILPFLERGLFAFVLTLPSNEAARRVVNHGQPPLYLEVTSLAREWESEHPGQVGLVVGATQADAARMVHKAAPGLPWLAPGVGAQGGQLAHLIQAAPGHLLLINVSRAICTAADPAAVARQLVSAIESAREGA